jgi:hypothetical protein
MNAYQELSTTNFFKKSQRMKNSRRAGEKITFVGFYYGTIQLFLLGVLMVYL